ncbi:hypothetical protein C7C46_18395 [Streptomyces tateyamensis]|uniref:Helix-turn-helix domain-containing protein n=1 Tax=Streptomyces tateyamensis TaxID=565073 RepID=A0A2V4N155_9ACTN|nr:hypothetical protein [Streptomyces tateyamensis]PYC77603.1 hypothetical protein C7C46_18395 [Streptomyces tateyamensis]
MLRNVIAPAGAHTRIADAHIWDDELSDTAFRLLVRALALSGEAARATTVTELAAGLAGGRLTVDRARRQLGRAGLLHSVVKRSKAGRLRTESLVSSVPLTEAEAEAIFLGRRPADRVPDVGKRQDGPPDIPSPGTVTPVVELPEEKESPLPVPPREKPEKRGEPEPESRAPGEAAAEQLLLSLRQVAPGLALGARQAARLAPLAAEWLARGATPAELRHALTSALPQPVKSPAALLRWRLRELMPEPRRARPAAPPLTTCEDCDRAFRPVLGEQRCGSCRTAAPQPVASAAPTNISWRDRIRLAT